MFDLMELAEKGRMPDAAIRAGIRKLLRDRIRMEEKDSREDQLEALYRFSDMMAFGPIAVATDTANEQHYEVPSDLFQTFMGPHLKYSCGYWPTPETTLEEAESAMLELTCRRAGLEDGMDILELGCGWGSLSLWMARHYPNARITAVSNSRTQKKFIDARGFTNLEVVTADMNVLRCSSICATGMSCCGGSTAGSKRTAGSSSISLSIGIWPISSMMREKSTGWRNIFSRKA